MLGVGVGVDGIVGNSSNTSVENCENNGSVTVGGNLQGGNNSSDKDDTDKDESDKDDSNKEENKSPATGDDNAIMKWFVIMAFSGMLAMNMVYTRRKENF